MNMDTDMTIQHNGSTSGHVGGISIFCWESSHATSFDAALLSTWIMVFGRDIIFLFTYADSGVRNGFD